MPISLPAVASLVLAVAPVVTAALPLVIAHRGASGHRPEHTLEAYRLASEMGADYIEPDLVSTRDGVLIARHENEIGETTDVAERFPGRRRTLQVDGRAVTGWFTEDFTLAEIRTLRARERLPFRSKEYDGQFGIPTFDEVVALAQQLGMERGRPLGVYPETKHPSHFRGIGLPLEGPLVEVLERRDWNRKDAPVFIQSFETGNLRELRTRTPVNLVQLIDARGGPFDRRGEATFSTVADLISDAGLRAIASYANGIGPHKALVLPADGSGRLLEPTDLVARAHAAGLIVHVWTLRSDETLLSPTYDGDPAVEYRQFRDLGVDGFFTDFPDAAVAALAP
ncbi:MAG: glycerophosphodiester phosphodiesterase [Acidimicrobiia bacterium]|nr:glycerophosphodiester phosphodiesterase [Acidimicrobiia bacterium]